MRFGGAFRRGRPFSRAGKIFRQAGGRIALSAACQTVTPFCRFAPGSSPAGQAFVLRCPVPCILQDRACRRTALSASGGRQSGVCPSDAASARDRAITLSRISFVPQQGDQPALRSSGGAVTPAARSRAPRSASLMPRSVMAARRAARFARLTGTTSPVTSLHIKPAPWP